jgi:tRNA(Ile)-lysidine synthase
LTLRHYERILSLARPGVTAKKMELPGGFVVQRERGHLAFAPSQTEASFVEPVRLDIPGRTNFGRYVAEATILGAHDVSLDKFISGRTKTVERFDLGKLKLPLTIRSRRAGDRFVPLSHASQKKLGKFLSAQYVPHRIRTRVLVVADMEKVIWVWPVRISERARLSPQTRRILQLKIADINAEPHISSSPAELKLI